MAHIQLPEGLPGIRGPMVFSPETTKPLCDLVQVLLTAPRSLTPAEREMIATYVSSQNDCIAAAITGFAEGHAFTACGKTRVETGLAPSQTAEETRFLDLS